MRISTRVVQETPNPTGLCLCGCGQPAPVAKATSTRRGRVAGQPMRYIRGHHMRGKRGPEMSGWKGGRWTHKGGYVYVFVPHHPAANRDGYVYEHRLVAEKMIGRYLEPWERIHHLNEIKTDNRPENLRVMESQAIHMREHAEEARERIKQITRAQRSEAGKKGAAARWKRSS